MRPAPVDPEGFVDRIAAPGPGPRLAVKDMIAVAGLLHTAGLAAHATRRATVDAAIVARFRAAGYAIAGTTASDTAGFGTMTPAVANPRHDGRAVGGSSGGAAAAVASGAAELGLGTDTGGSVRIPAAYCDLWAFKASNGRVPMDGIIPLSQTFDAPGLLAADVATLTAGAKVLLPDFGSTRGQPPRLAIDGDGREALDPALAPAFDAIAAALGARTVLMPPAPYLDAAIAHSTIVTAEAYATYRGDPAYTGRSIPDEILAAFDHGATLRRDDIAAARAMVTAMRAAVARAFARSGTDVMIAPTLPMPPASRYALQAMVKGTSLPITNANIRTTFRANIAGLPVVVAPLGPMSIQFIGPNGSDEALLAHAATMVAQMNGDRALRD